MTDRTNHPKDGSTLAAGLVSSHNLIGNDVWWANLAAPTQPERGEAHPNGWGLDVLRS